MATIRKFCCNDLLGISSLNLDNLTYTRNMHTYMACFIRWSDYNHVAVAPGNRIIGYILGGDTIPPGGKDWQGLVMAVSVASEYRRQCLATELMQLLEKLLVNKMRSSAKDRHVFIYLYVGLNNIPAIRFFEKLRFEIFANAPNCCPDNENNKDGYEMRKELN